MASPLKKLLLPLLLLLCVGTFSSCGAIAYRYAWSDFEPEPDGSGMVGKWEGSWESERDGHSGGLRCMMSREGDDAYVARFYSTYGLFFFFRHEATFRVVSREDGVHFEGEEDLGSLAGGVYQYQGHVADGQFEACYDAENGDHGTFRMERLE